MGDIRVGTASWTDKTLIDSGWYPKKSMSAKERLAFYADRFRMVEVDATYYFPPTQDLAGLWKRRTPDDFRMDVKAYSLLTGHPTKPDSVWEDVYEQVLDEHRDKRNVYLEHFPPAAIDLAWEHFHDALKPLDSAGKLGAVFFQFPPWFHASRASRAFLSELADRLPGYQIAVEFRHRSWLADTDDARRTLDLLEDLGLAFVCVDGPQGFDSSVPPITAATADLAVVRFHGHNRETWEKSGISTAERFAYLYEEDELRDWVDPIRDLASEASETHAVMNNCYGDYGVRNAGQLATLLGVARESTAEEHDEVDAQE